MSKKILIPVICITAVSLIIFFYILNKPGRKVGLDLNKDEVQRINISFSLPLFDAFDITDAEQVNKVVDYLNSLYSKVTKADPSKHTSAAYIVKISLKNDIERTLILAGNTFFIEENRFTYEIPYEEAIKFDTIVAGMLEGIQSKKDEASITGTVTSVNAASSGLSISCIIKAEDDKAYNINLLKAKIIDATGNGRLILREKDFIRVFYPKAAQTSNNTVDATVVFIKSSAR